MEVPLLLYLIGWIDKIFYPRFTIGRILTFLISNLFC